MAKIWHLSARQTSLALCNISLYI